MISHTLVGGLSGAVVGLVIAKLYISKHEHDGRTEAYESGWNDGYDVARKAHTYSKSELTDEYNRGWRDGFDNAWGDADELPHAPPSSKRKRVKKIKKVEP